uniref:Uncharacterized protein n=1 Tax=Aegilops tauschii subsp. strangulata TaxID=200361 RepID=A0A453CAR5_AEGTS
MYLEPELNNLSELNSMFICSFGRAAKLPQQCKLQPCSL